MGRSDKALSMIDALRALTVPYLRENNYKGSYPHFRRFINERIELLSFQFCTISPGMYTINLAAVPADGNIISTYTIVPPNKLTAVHISEHARLTREDFVGDHWFVYDDIYGKHNNTIGDIGMTYAVGTGEPYEFLARATIALIGIRADIILNNVFHRIYTIKTLSKGQLQELKSLVSRVPPDNYTMYRISVGSYQIEYDMGKYVGDYLSGLLCKRLDAYQSLSETERNKLDTYIKEKYKELNFDNPCSLNNIAFHIAHEEYWR